MNNENSQLNVLFSADDNYAQHLGAAVYSLLATNMDFEKINIFVVDNEISEDNKEKLFEVVNLFCNANMTLLDFLSLKEKLSLNMPWHISISAYARLFVSELLPRKVKKILYLDCDMIVQDSLTGLWNTDFQGNVLAAVQDVVGDSIKTSVGLSPEQQYFNSGMLLIDIDEWNRQNIGAKCLEFIEIRKGSVVHHDQGVLNGVLKNCWRKVDIKYNLMTIHYFFNLHQINKYYRNHSDFYSEEEITQAKNKPTIIHYTPSFTTRPWVKNCKHPLIDKYWEALANTPWKYEKLKTDCSKWYVKLINWRYRNKVFI